MQTKNLTLVLESLEDARAGFAAMSPEVKAQLSADWLARLAALTTADPWVIGFSMVHRETGEAIGQCGFKGPPDPDGMVEIAYGISPEHQGRGYATEAAAALYAWACQDPRVRLVRAHTLPTPNASTRILTKLGFRHLGEVIDPEDGPVWRWEKPR